MQHVFSKEAQETTPVRAEKINGVKIFINYSNFFLANIGLTSADVMNLFFQHSKQRMQ